MAQSVKGTRDLFGNELTGSSTSRIPPGGPSAATATGEIRTPILEEMEVFKRSVGESSDIVHKEMYDFLDKGGRHVAMRPERSR